MSHTNSTINYALPQFLSTDKPAWLTDVNPAYSAIDTGIHNAQVAADAAQGDATQALSDAASADGKATTADAKGSGAIASLSDDFSTTNTYSVDDVVIYNNLLYICIADVTTPGPWTGSTNWSRTTIESLVSNSISALSGTNLPLNNTPGAPSIENSIGGGFVDGSSGVWTWRKYNNGNIEIWGKMISTEPIHLTQWGNGLYGCDLNGIGSYPVALTSIEYIEGAAFINGLNGFSSIVYSASLTNAPSYIWDRGTTSADSERDVIRTIYVKGKWN